MKKNSRLPLSALLIAYILLAGIYSVVNPLFESPDEVWHYEYVRWLVEGNGLATPEDVGHAPWHQEGSQPPLYYLTAAALTAWIPTDNAPQVIRYNPHAAVGQADSFGNKNVMVHGSAEAWPWQGVTLAAHLARFYSILLGTLTVLATYGAGRIVVPSNRWIALLAASIVAFNPQFLFLTAAVNNDNLVTCISAIGIWYGLRLVSRAYGTIAAQGTERLSDKSGNGQSGSSKQGNRQRVGGPSDVDVALFGVLAGLSALSKLSGLLLSIFVALTLATIAYRQRSWRVLIRWGFISGGAMVLVSGWWYIRNWILFGDPLALSAMFDILPRRAEPPTTDELIARAEGIWNSVWAVFGWFNVIVPKQLYWFYSGLAVAGVVGFAAALIARLLATQSKGTPPQAGQGDQRAAGSNDLTAGTVVEASNAGRSSSAFWPQIGLLVIWVSMMVLSLWRWAQMRYPQGRLLFPALSATAILLAIGLNFWMPRFLPKAGRAFIQTGLITVMLAIAIVVPWRYISPAYEAVQSADIETVAGSSQGSSGSGAEPAQPAVTNGEANTPELAIPSDPFGGLIQLVDAQLSATELQRGDRLTVALQWEARQPIDRDLSIFVHLVDENGILQAQRDSYPGQGNLPTSEWDTATTIYDQHVVDVPITVPAPAKLKVNIGLYDFATGERLLIGGSDHWTLGFVRLSPPAGDGTLPNSVFVNFEDKIALVGFEFDRYVLSPGETLIVKLWWQALDAPLRDIKVFTHLVLPPDATWAQDDDRPRAGTAKTDSWQLDDRIEDQYEMTLPENAPEGVYFVEIGLYDGETYERLKVNFSDKGTVIGQVRVTE